MNIYRRFLAAFLAFVLLFGQTFPVFAQEEPAAWGSYESDYSPPSEPSTPAEAPADPPPEYTTTWDGSLGTPVSNDVDSNPAANQSTFAPTTYTPDGYVAPDESQMEPDQPGQGAREIYVEPIVQEDNPNINSDGVRYDPLQATDPEMLANISETRGQTGDIIAALNALPDDTRQAMQGTADEWQVLTNLASESKRAEQEGTVFDPSKAAENAMASVGKNVDGTPVVINESVSNVKDNQNTGFLNQDNVAPNNSLTNLLANQDAGQNPIQNPGQGSNQVSGNANISGNQVAQTSQTPSTTSQTVSDNIQANINALNNSIAQAQQIANQGATTLQSAGSSSGGTQTGSGNQQTIAFISEKIEAAKKADTWNSVSVSTDPVTREQFPLMPSSALNTKTNIVQTAAKPVLTNSDQNAALNLSNNISQQAAASASKLLQSSRENKGVVLAAVASPANSALIKTIATADTGIGLATNSPKFLSNLPSNAGAFIQTQVTDRVGSVVSTIAEAITGKDQNNVSKNVVDEFREKTESKEEKQARVQGETVAVAKSLQALDSLNQLKAFDVKLSGDKTSLDSFTLEASSTTSAQVKLTNVQIGDNKIKETDWGNNIDKLANSFYINFGNKAFDKDFGATVKKAGLSQDVADKVTVKLASNQKDAAVKFVKVGNPLVVSTDTVDQVIKDVSNQIKFENYLSNEEVRTGQKPESVKFDYNGVEMVVPVETGKMLFQASTSVDQKKEAIGTLLSFAAMFNLAKPVNEKVVADFTSEDSAKSLATGLAQPEAPKKAPKDVYDQFTFKAEETGTKIRSVMHNLYQNYLAAIFKVGVPESAFTQGGLVLMDRNNPQATLATTSFKDAVSFSKALNSLNDFSSPTTDPATYNIDEMYIAQLKETAKLANFPSAADGRSAEVWIEGDARKIMSTVKADIKAYVNGGKSDNSVNQKMLAYLDHANKVSGEEEYLKLVELYLTAGDNNPESLQAASTLERKLIENELLFFEGTKLGQKEAVNQAASLQVAKQAGISPESMTALSAILAAPPDLKIIRLDSGLLQQICGQGKSGCLNSSQDVIYADRKYNLPYNVSWVITLEKMQSPDFKNNPTYKLVYQNVLSDELALNIIEGMTEWVTADLDNRPMLGYPRMLWNAKSTHSALMSKGVSEKDADVAMLNASLLGNYGDLVKKLGNGDPALGWSKLKELFNSPASPPETTISLVTVPKTTVSTQVLATGINSANNILAGTSAALSVNNQTSWQLIKSAFAASNSNGAKVVTQQEYARMVKAGVAANSLAKNSRITSDDIKYVNSIDLLPQVVYQFRNKTVLKTGQDKLSKVKLEPTSYRVNVAAVPGFDIEVPKAVKIDGKHNKIAINIKKGSGQVKKIVTNTNSWQFIKEAQAATSTALSASNVETEVMVFENDKPVSLANLEITLDKVQKEKSFEFTPGWHLFSLNVLPEGGMTASSLLADIAENGGYATTVSRLNQGKWESFVIRGDKTYSGKDFAIEPGKAYFLRIKTGTILTVKGQDFVSPVPVKIKAGWNAVGVPYANSSYQADTLLQSLNQQKAEADAIAAFFYGLWNTYLTKNGQGFGDDFTIDPGAGYLIRAKKTIKYTP